jgi:hypothetical protein
VHLSATVDSCFTQQVCSTFVFLLLPIFLGGCYTATTLEQGELPPDDTTVIFRLTDGSRIYSPRGNHHRVELGYQVIGELLRDNNFIERLDRIVLDDEIAGITARKARLEGTLVIVAGIIVLSILIVTGWGRTSL